MKQVFIAFLLLFSVSTLVVMPGCKADPEKTELTIQQTLDLAHELGYKGDSAIINNPELAYPEAKAWLANRPDADSSPAEWAMWVKVGIGIFISAVLGLFYWARKQMKT